MKMKLKKKRFPRSFTKKKKKDLEETEAEISAIILPTTPSTFFDLPFTRDTENGDSAMSMSPLSSPSPVCMSPTCASPTCASPSTDDGIDGDISELFTELIKEVEFNDAHERELNFDRFTLDTISSCSVSSSPDLNIDDLEDDIFLNLSEKQDKDTDENEVESSEHKDSRNLVKSECKDSRHLVKSECKDSRNLVKSECKDSRHLVKSGHKDSLDLMKSGELDKLLNTICTCNKVCFRSVEVKHVEIKPQTDGCPEKCLVIGTCKAMVRISEKNNYIDFWACSQL